MTPVPPDGPQPVAPREHLVVLTGNPNCGKTTLFNALTGLRAKVGNYAGVTVERKEGRLRGTPPHLRITLLDLPGSYSLSPQSPDEAVARDVLLCRLPEVGIPSVVVILVDASNLERNLYYATQVIELGYPTVVGLNMMDVAADNGTEVDCGDLSGELGVPVVPLVASRGEGLDRLRSEILRLALHPRESTVPKARRFVEIPEALEREWAELAGRTVGAGKPGMPSSRLEALLLLTDDKALVGLGGRWPADTAGWVASARARLEEADVDWTSAAIEGRYARISSIHEAVAKACGEVGETMSDRLDRIVTHRVWGPLIFVGLMFLMFQAIFTLAEWPMGWIEGGVGWLADSVRGAMPSGDLRDLLTDGVIAGVGAVIVFLPQILLLFLFLGMLEDTGYMARAAFLMDRLMSKVGLHGKSFIPLLGSFACAIPGIMATRTIETPKDRLVTILVAPLMSCSARLPVYTVLIAACIPNVVFLGFLKLSALTMLGMYLLGIVVALGMAWIFKKTLLKGHTPLLIMELPPYKRPGFRAVLRHMLDRSMLFLRRAGTVILVINMVLWVLATYPRSAEREAGFEEQLRRAAAGDGVAAADRVTELEREHAGERLRHSFAGVLGRAMEPWIAPLGFDWKIGIGLVASFAAREVFVSTMSTVYNVGEFDDSAEGTRGLAAVMQSQRREDGSPVYTPLTGVTLMVFYVFALQCVSTIAVVRRETNAWKWPLFQLAYMTALAWILAFVTYQGGRWLGFS
ncbi:MAG: ferrous iron transport protein B [Limisphaerales bacterium]